MELSVAPAETEPKKHQTNESSPAIARSWDTSRKTAIAEDETMPPWFMHKGGPIRTNRHE